MKLAIGENIRNFRKKNDLTQEELADRLGVTYQSISRWENGTTYPDLELIPSIAEELSVTVDELLGMPQIEKKKRAVQTFDELRRECIKRDYDADKIVDLLRDIRRNLLGSDSAWRPWVEGNDRAFRDPKILPEARVSFFRDNICRYYNTNEKILSGNFTEAEWNSWYEAVIEPIAIQLSLEFSFKLFSERQRGHGNKIVFTSNRLQYATLQTRATIGKDLFDRGAITINQYLELMYHN